MSDLIPESKPDDPWYLKGLDVASAPARELVKWVAQGMLAPAEAWDSFMASPNPTHDPQVQQNMLQGAASLGALGQPTEGLPSFPGWHGSRHVFEAEPGAPFGQFRESAINSGEGAQVYSWGHYIAGKRDVAETYRRAGADFDEPYMQMDGQSMHPHDLRNSDPVGSKALYEYMDSKGDHVDAINNLRETAQMRREMGDEAAAHGEGGSTHYQMARNADAGADWLEKNHHRLQYFAPNEDPGNLYQVWIRPEHHEFLDWDKTFEEQSPHVQMVLEHAFPETAKAAKADPDMYYGMKGGEIYRDIAGKPDTRPFMQGLLRGEQQASEALDAAGIPGVKFLDQNSRGMPKEIYHQGQLWEPERGTPEALAIHMIKKGRTPWGNLRNYNLQENIDDAIKGLEFDVEDGVPGHSLGLSHIYEMPGQKVSHIDRTEDALKWLESNRNDLTMGDHPNATHNYVVFHHRNLHVIDRNGQVHGLNPVDHNPFEVP